MVVYLDLLVIDIIIIHLQNEIIKYSPHIKVDNLIMRAICNL